MSYPPKYNYAELQRLAAKYEQIPYFSFIPLALHPTLQLIPVIGSIIVFVQTTEFVRAIDSIARVPREQSKEIWVSAVVVMFLGMIPFVGVILSVVFKCNLCTDYLLETTSYLRQSAYFYQQQSTQLLKRPVNDGAMTPKSMFMSRPESINLSPFSSHEHIAAYAAANDATSDGAAVITTSPSSSSSNRPRKAGSTRSTKRKETDATLVGLEEVAISVKEPEAAKHHSVFNRVSKQDWMEEVMALSPTDNYRTSFSANLFTHSQAPTQYSSLRELASRNSRITPSSATKNLPTYLMHANANDNDGGEGAGNDAVKIALSSKRMTQSLHLENSVFDEHESLSKGLKLLERPDYSHLERNGAGVTRASSMVETGSRNLV